MMESGGEERKVRGAIKKARVGSEAIYPEIPCWKKNDEVP
jgi:hypothetical protein